MPIKRKPALNLTRPILRAFFFATALTWVAATSGFGFTQQSWNFFRGNEFDGKSKETNIADQWPDKGPPVLWTRDLGAGYSSFVGDGDRVFTQHQTLTAQSVICLDARTGQTVWEHTYGWAYQPASLYPGPRSTPTLSNGRLFYTTPTGSLGCLDVNTGDPIWKVEAAEKFSAPDPEFGYACSPVCVDGKVIIPVGGKDASMVAFDERDGSVVWTAGNDSISYCSAYPIEFEGRKLVVGYFKNKLCIFDRDKGTLLTTTVVSFDYDEHSAWPIYREPYLWISGPFRAGSQLLKLSNVPTDIAQANQNDGDDRTGSTLRLSPVYKSDTMSNDVASSVLHDGQIYGFDLRDVQSKVHRPSRGQFICMDFLTGDTRWINGTLGRRKKTEEFIASASDRDASDVGHSSVIYVDGKLILFSDTGELILCRANQEKLEPLARAQILGGDICWAPPMLMNRSIVVRNHTKAVCVYVGDVADLELNESEIVFASDISQPEFFDLSAVVIGTEPTYAMTSPKAQWLFRWFWISMLLGWGVAPLLALLIAKLFRLPARPIVLVTAILFGLVGTTFFGRWLSEFYFSWPIVLAIVFEVLVCRLKNKNPDYVDRPWLSRIMLIGFVILIFGYFYLCRRLSLAFEWAFLLGFPSAIPFLWLVKGSVQSHQPYNWRQWFWSAVAFAAFYWTGAGIMLWKYA